jgi:Mlc titration factor MtfA (ptsG expression regulator)
LNECSAESEAAAVVDAVTAADTAVFIAAMSEYFVS